MSQSSNQSIFKSFLFPAAILALAFVVGIFIHRYNPSIGAWLVFGLIYLVGLIYEIILYRNDAEETITPQVLMSIGLAIFFIWIASN